MTTEERKALSFVAILIGLSVVARAINRPEPVIVAGASAVDIGGRLQENQQVRERAASTGAPAMRAPAAPESLRRNDPEAIIDVNRATAEELDALPGVGPAVAQRIVEYRATHGAFRSLEQLDSVKGIGPALLARIAPRIRFSR